MNNFSSSLDEELEALNKTIKWIRTYQSEFLLPKHYAEYLTSLYCRLNGFLDIQERKLNDKN